MESAGLLLSPSDKNYDNRFLIKSDAGLTLIEVNKSSQEMLRKLEMENALSFHEELNSEQEQSSATSEEETKPLELADKLKKLEDSFIKASVRADTVNGTTAHLYQAMIETPQGAAWNEMDELRIEAKSNLVEAEDAYKEAMIEYFEATKLKDYKFGQIKMFDNAFYSDTEAVAWSIEHKLTECLQLNRNIFMDIAKSLHLGWVMHLEIPKATIARTAVDKAIKQTADPTPPPNQ